MTSSLSGVFCLDGTAAGISTRRPSSQGSTLAMGKATWGPKRRSCKGAWKPEEDEILQAAVRKYEGRNWKKIASYLPDKTDIHCLHRWQKVLDPELLKGPWSPEEDEVILTLVAVHGPKKWSFISSHLPGRIGKQCRERWHNHLNPDIKRGSWSKEEVDKLFALHSQYGNRWTKIAAHLPGRADNAVKNFWNTNMKKRLNGREFLRTGSTSSAADSTAHFDNAMLLEAPTAGRTAPVLLRVKSPVKCPPSSESPKSPDSHEPPPEQRGALASTRQEKDNFRRTIEGSCCSLEVRPHGLYRPKAAIGVPNIDYSREPSGQPWPHSSVPRNLQWSPAYGAVYADHRAAEDVAGEIERRADRGSAGGLSPTRRLGGYYRVPPAEASSPATRRPSSWHGNAEFWKSAIFSSGFTSPMGVRGAPSHGLPSYGYECDHFPPHPSPGVLGPSRMSTGGSAGSSPQHPLLAAAMHSAAAGGHDGRPLPYASAWQAALYSSRLTDGFLAEQHAYMARLEGHLWERGAPPSQAPQV